MRKLSTLICLIILFSSCKKEKTIWDSEWQLPLVYDSLTLTNLVEDSILSINNGVYVVDFNKTVYELKLSQFVKFPDTTVDHNYSFNLALNVPPGSSFVNSIQEHEIGLDDIQLKQVTIKNGGIELEVKNPIGTKTFFTVELPGVTKNGAVLSKNFEVPAGTPSNPGKTLGFVDLEGYTIDLRGQYAGSFNRIQTKMLVKSDPNGPAVNITTSDVFHFVFKMNDINLSFARGYFGEQLLSDTINANIPFLENVTDGLLNIDPATVSIQVENGLKVSSRLKVISLKNTNAQGNTVLLSHPIIGNNVQIDAASGTGSSLQPSYTNLLFDQNNSNLEQYLENHGAKNEVAFQVQLNPWGNTSGGYDEIYDDHPIRLKVNADLPLNIGLNNLTIQDTFALNLSQKEGSSRIKEGTMMMDIVNAFPFEGALKVSLLDQNNTIIAVLTPSDHVASSIYGAVVNGILQKQSKLYLDLPASVLSNTASIKKCVVQVKLDTPDLTGSSVQVSIPQNAFFKFKVGTKFILENSL